MTKDLLKVRKKIDKIDKRIQKYLLKREKLVKKVKEIKSKNKIEITDKNREKEILEKIENKYVKKIFEFIVETSKSIQR